MNRLKLLFPYILLTGITAVVVVGNWPEGSKARVQREMVSASICAPCGMEVDPTDALQAEIRGQTHYFCGEGCRSYMLAHPDESVSRTANNKASDGRLVDVVCHMEVSAAWDITADHDGKTYYFCTERCKERFQEGAEPFLRAKCPVCDEPLGDGPLFPATYLGRTYELCSEEHRASFKADQASYFMHTMWGIPASYYYASIGLVLVVSFGVFDVLGRKSQARSRRQESSTARKRIDARNIKGDGERLIGERFTGQPGASLSIALPILATARPTAKQNTDRFDLLSVRWISWAFRSRAFRFTLQAIVSALFLVVIAAGLWGNQNPALNIAPILTWTIWWGALIILILFAGKAWCYVCPWDALAGWTEKLALWRKRSDGLSLGLKWPRIVRNVSIATILFVGLTWIELGFGVTMKPRVTAYLAIAMLLMAVLSAMLFDRKSFCRYGCLVGRVSGLYALFASTEIRAKSDVVCKSCHGKECVTGSEAAYGCPTFQFPGKMSTNTYCIQCMECVQACPSDNLAVNLRPWGSDLVAAGKPRSDEAYLALLMLAITGFHGLTMTPAWQQLIDGIRGLTSVGRTIGFSVGMALLMLGPIGIYATIVWMSQRLGKRHALTPLTYRDYFIRYAYALLPIALFYHIAHNMEHLLMEGPKVLALASDPFGWGWNMFGTAGWTIPPMISLAQLWMIQVLLVLIGHVYSLWVAQKTSLRLFGDVKAAFRSQLPMLMGMIAFSVFSLWLLKQPMEMRTSAM